MDGQRELSKLFHVASYHEKLKLLNSAELKGTHLFPGNSHLIREGSIKKNNKKCSSQTLNFSAFPLPC